MDSKGLGKKGELLAGKRLAGMGYRILERNYRTPAGELDIVASDGGTLVFVEVKSRRTDSFGAPELAVDSRKQRMLVRAALAYISNKKMEGTPCRFDVVSVTGFGGGEPCIEVIKDAFELDGGNLR